MRALVRTVLGEFAVDLEDEEVVPLEETIEFPPPIAVAVQLPGVVASAASGSTVVALLGRRPPLAISYDAGTTWREAGGGLPAGRAVAISAEHPDLVVYAARNRLFVSRDGGRFWRALAVELPEIEAVAVA